MADQTLEVRVRRGVGADGHDREPRLDPAVAEPGGALGGRGMQLLGERLSVKEAH